MLPSLSGLTLEAKKPVVAIGANGEGSPSGAKPFQAQADALMDEFKDVEATVQRANLASSNQLEALQQSATAKQAYQKLSREAERAQKRYQKAMEAEIEEGLLMSHTEDWYVEKEGMRAEIMLEIARLMHQSSFAPPWPDHQMRPGGGAKASWPMSTDQRKYDSLMKQLVKAYKKLENTATSIKQIGDDRKAFQEAKDLVEKEFKKRKLLVEQRQNPKNLARAIIARRGRKAEFEAWDSAEARRARRIAVQNKKRELAKEKRKAAEEAAIAAEEARKIAEKAQQEKDEACSEALGQLHEFRADLKKLADQMAEQMQQVREQCSPAQEGEDVLDPWMMEMLQKALEMQQWIEQREREDPEDWDVNGHLATLGESDNDDYHTDSDSDSGSGSDSGSQSASDDEEDAMVAAIKKEAANEQLKEAMDAALTEEEYAGFMAWDDEWQAFEASIRLHVPPSQAPSPQLAKPAIATVENAFDKLLGEIEANIKFSMPHEAMIVDYFKKGVINITMTITEEMYEAGKQVSGDEPTPRARLQELMLNHWDKSKWSEHLGMDVLKITIGGDDGEYPEYTAEEEELLDRRVPGWFEMPYIQRMAMQAKARLWAEARSAEETLKAFKATEKEIRDVWTVFGKDRGWPEDWFTNEEFAKTEPLPASEKYRLLYFMRHGGDEEMGDAEAEEEL